MLHFVLVFLRLALFAHADDAVHRDSDIYYEQRQVLFDAIPFVQIPNEINLMVNCLSTTVQIN